MEVAELDSVLNSAIHYRSPKVTKKPKQYLPLSPTHFAFTLSPGQTTSKQVSPQASNSQLRFPLREPNMTLVDLNPPRRPARYSNLNLQNQALKQLMSQQDEMLKLRTFHSKTKTMQDREKISFLNESFKRLPSHAKLHNQVSSVTKISRLYD